MTWLILFFNLGEVINFARGGNLIAFLGKIDLLISTAGISFLQEFKQTGNPY